MSSNNENDQGGDSLGKLTPPANPQPQQTTTASGTSPTTSNVSPASVSMSDPIMLLSNQMYEQAKAEQWSMLLATFESLQEIDGLENGDTTHLAEIQRAWGRAMEASTHVGADDEHLAEMVQEFEERFGKRSLYLQAFLIKAPDPCSALQILHTQEGKMNGDGVNGVFDNYRKATTAQCRQCVQLCKSLNVLTIPEISERLLKTYVVRMKAEDPEDVYEEIITDGLVPSIPHPFNFLFMKSENLKKSPMYYYNQMIDFGIKSDVSTLRILGRVKHKDLTKDEAAMLRRRSRGDTAPEEWYLNKLRACQTDSNLEEAERLFNRMLVEGIIPDKYVYNYVFLCCRRSPEKVEDWYKKMLDSGVEPNAVTFTNVITVWKDSKFADQCDKWINEMVARGMHLDNHNYCALLDAFVRSGNRAKAMQYFKKVLEKGPCGITIYNTIMKIGPFDWAFGCLACILSEGLQPTTHTRHTMQSMARDEISSQILQEISACGWSKDNMMLSPALVSPTKGTTPSLMDCMRFMMRQMAVEESAMEHRCEMLNAEIIKAKMAMAQQK